MILLQVSSKTCIYRIFKLEQKSIIETFCENKNKPELHSHRSCFLKKELNEQDKNKNQRGNLLKEKFDRLYSEIQNKNQLFSEYKLLHFPQTKLNSITGFDGNVFLPPKFFLTLI